MPIQVSRLPSPTLGLTQAWNPRIQGKVRVISSKLPVVFDPSGFGGENEGSNGEWQSLTCLVPLWSAVGCQLDMAGVQRWVCLLGNFCGCLEDPLSVFQLGTTVPSVYVFLAIQPLGEIGTRLIEGDRVRFRTRVRVRWERRNWTCPWLRPQYPSLKEALAKGGSIVFNCGKNI